MKSKHLVFISVAIVLSSCMSITSGVSTKYDEFTKTTIHSAKATLATITPPGWFHLLGIIYEKESKQSYYLGFEYSGSAWYFFDKIYLILDGENFAFSSDDYSRNVQSGGTVSERIIFVVDKNILSKIANSVIVKIKVTGSKGSFTYQLKESEQRYFKDLLAIKQ